MSKNTGILETLIATLNRIAEAEERSAAANEKLLVAMAQATIPQPQPQSEPTPKKEETPKPKSSQVEVKDNTLTQKDVIAACKQLSRAVNKQAVFKVFKEFGADSVKDLNEADYGKVRDLLISKVEQEVLDHAKSLSEGQHKAIAKKFNIKRLNEPKDKLDKVLEAVKEALAAAEDDVNF